MFVSPPPKKRETEEEEEEGREFLGRKEGGGGKKRRERGKIAGFLDTLVKEGWRERQKAELTFLHPLPGVRGYNVVNSTFSRAGAAALRRPAPPPVPLTRLYAGKQSCGNPIDPTGHIRPVTSPLTRPTLFPPFKPSESPLVSVFLFEKFPRSGDQARNLSKILF